MANATAETTAGRRARGAGWRARYAPLAPYFMIAFSLLGMADAFYVAQASYTGLPLWCPLIEGCNIVAQSPQARIFGVPLAYLGLVFYAYMFGFALLLALDPQSRGLRLGAVLYTAIGVGYSLYAFYVQAVFIGAFCIYCMISAVLTLLLHLAALWCFTASRIAGRAPGPGLARPFSPG